MKLNAKILLIGLTTSLLTFSGCVASSSKIHTAAAAGDIVTLKAEVNRGVSIDKDVKGMGTPLCQAAGNGDLRTARYLIAKGANINALTSNHTNALHFAVGHKKVEMVEFLLKEGIDINTQANISNLTPLLLAVHDNSSDIVKILLENGADTKIRASDYSRMPAIYQGRTALEMAEYSNNHEIVSIIKSTTNNARHKNVENPYAIQSSNSMFIPVKNNNWSSLSKSSKEVVTQDTTSSGNTKMLEEKNDYKFQNALDYSCSNGNGKKFTLTYYTPTSLKGTIKLGGSTMNLNVYAGLMSNLEKDEVLYATSNNKYVVALNPVLGHVKLRGELYICSEKR